MLDFLLFVVASVGMTAILVDGKIFAPLREYLADHSRFLREKRERLNLRPTWTFSEFLESIFSCYQCCGFWCGLFCGLLLITPVSDEPARRFVLVHTVVLWFCCGAAGSLFAHIYYWCIELISALALLVKSHIPMEDHHHHHAHPEDDA